MAVADVLKQPQDRAKPGGVAGWLRVRSRTAMLAVAVGILAMISGLVTYGIVMGFIPYTLTKPGIIALLLINFALALTLGALIASRMARLWSNRRAARAGARLHARLVGMFAGIAVVPVIFVAVFAVVTLNLGIEQWNSLEGAERGGQLHRHRPSAMPRIVSAC